MIILQKRIGGTHISCLLFGYIQSSNLFPEPLSSEEEKIFLERLKNNNDDEARNILIERNLRLVAHVAKKYSSTNIEQDDLISIGTIGLIKGINSFNMDKNIRLATYVARCIENATFTCWKLTWQLVDCLIN